MKKADAESILKDRLIDAGAQFKGPFPSAREVLQNSFPCKTFVTYFRLALLR